MNIQSGRICAFTKGGRLDIFCLKPPARCSAGEPSVSDGTLALRGRRAVSAPVWGLIARLGVALSGRGFGPEALRREKFVGFQWASTRPNWC